jgi:hypothetical protein
VVEGTREEPVVYHCNAISTAGSPMEAALTAGGAGLAQNRIGLAEAGGAGIQAADLLASDR